MNLSAAQTEMLRAKFTRPATYLIGEHLVAPVPNDRAVVIRDAIRDCFRKPLEESAENRRLAAASKGKRRPLRRKRNCPDTSRGANCLEIAAQLREDEAADLLESDAKSTKRARKAEARDNKFTIELRGALDDLIVNVDISRLSLPKIKTLLVWKNQAVPKPWNNKTKPTGIATWNGLGLSQEVIYAERSQLPNDDDDDDDMEDVRSDDDNDDEIYHFPIAE